MAKRKREADDDSGPVEKASSKQRRVERRLKLGVTKLGHAFKVAKGFERQKLGRRRKKAVAEKNQKDVDRIDTEIAALKSLDTGTAARHHLHKILSKTKLVLDHRDLPDEVLDPVKFPTDTASLNVNARLCKSKPVKEALETAVTEIQTVLGIASENATSLKEKRRTAKDILPPPPTSKYPEKDHETAGKSQLRPMRTVDRDLAMGDNDLNEIDQAFSELDDRIASSQSEDEHENADLAKSEGQLTTKGVRRGRPASPPAPYDVEADLSLSESDYGKPSASPEPRKAPVSTNTSFLPSLTMGGYISGSDSEIEDVDVAPKKNRRGQRERQKIWEMKYGSKAKHLQKEDRNQGWDPKRGATDSNDRRWSLRNQRMRRSSPDYTVGGDGGPISRTNNELHKNKRKQNDANRPLHPSWEAAKKAKEKKDAPVAFQGKKTTFD